MLSIWSRLGRLLLSWSVLMTIAGAAAYALALLPGAVIEEPSQSVLLLGLGFASVFAGGIAGVVQRIYLRPYWEFSSSWAWASAAGWGLGIPLAVFLSAVLRERVADFADVARLFVFLAAAGLTGVLSSFGQWLLLRKVTRRHYWWLIGNGIGWLMAWIVVLAAGFFIGGGEPLPATPDRVMDALFLGGLAGLVVGFEQSIAIVGVFTQTAWEKSKTAVD